MSEPEQRRSPPRLAPRPAILQHVPQQTIKKTKTRISNACLACKARKTKCDNNKPKCSACTARPNSECVYMPFLDRRKRQKIISDDDAKQREHELLTKIFNATKYCSQEELPQLLDLIRGESSIEQIGQYVQDHLETTQFGYGQSSGMGTLLEPEPEDAEHDVETDFGVGDQGHPPEVVDSAYSFRKSSNAMDISSIMQVSVVAVPSKPWTNVTDDDELVSHLIQLYFTWESPIHDIVEKECFLADMKAGNPETASYCSPLLVNAMLATACLHSDRTESFEDFNDKTSSGCHFFADAERIWNTMTTPTVSLTIMQALATMHYFQAYRGNGGVGIRYLNRAMEMYGELSSGEFNFVDKRGKPLRVAWPCWKLWTCRCITSIVLRQSYRVPTPKLPRPKVSETVESNDMWQPYPQIARSHPHRRMELANYCIELAFIVRDISLFFYTKEKYNPEARFLVKFHNDLLQWYDSYSKVFISEDGRIGPDLTIRMWYHGMEIHLFRSAITGVAMASRENCSMISAVLKAAFASGALQKLYSQLYGSKITMQVTYNAFQSSLVTLYFLERVEFKDTFLHCIKVLSRLGRKRTLSAFQLSMVGLLAQREGLELPDEAQTILKEIGSVEKKFKNLTSRLPMPATSGGGPALNKYKAELLQHESTDYTFQWQGPRSSQDEKPDATIPENMTQTLKPPDFANGIDPAVGDLAEVYQKWSIFGP